jgi:hypothetical protein
MAKSNKTFFSKADLYHFADEILSMHKRLSIVLGFAKMNNNQVMIDAYSPIIWELDLLIEAYGLREMVKIN